jgi:hypothetical protein
MSSLRAFGVVCLIVGWIALSPAVASGTTYGQPLTGSDTIPIPELLSHPDDYLGEVVRVRGLVTKVCAKRGCWMAIAADEEEFKEIRIKVDDGVIVFPMEAKGHRAIAEGVFSKIELTMEQTLQMREHECMESGEKFDPSAVKGPMVVYQIKGHGAVIE